MNYIVNGAKRDTAENVSISIQANSEEDARRIASERGILIASIQIDESKNAVTDNVQQINQFGLIQKYREDFEKAVKTIDNDVPLLISEGKELKALITLSEQLNSITKIHEDLNVYYGFYLRNYNVLKKFKSERIQQLGHVPIPTWDYLKETDDSKEPYQHYADVINQFKKMGCYKKHWIIWEIIFNEVNYMLDALTILVEPDFIPADDSSSESQNPEAVNIDRYIPPTVKIAVWQRDQGKCVICGSREKIEYDHIIPVGKGGSNTARNIQLLCEKCNRKKGSNIGG